MSASPSSRTSLGLFAQFESGVPYRFAVGEAGVVVVRIGDRVYALDDRCSHQKVRLSEGDVLEDELEIECYKHGSTFSLATGQAMSLPATRPVLTHSVTVEDGTVYLDTEGQH